jgi:hypothetical protein
VITFLHIPKTGGTALKSLAKDGLKFFNVCNTHQHTLKSYNRVIFCVRDPWQRFCSGFWEAKTLYLRKQLAHQEENRFYKIGSYNKLDKLPDWHSEILSQTTTPSDLYLLLERAPEYQELLYDFDQDDTYKTHTALGIATQSLCWWLGSLTEYQEQEKRVVSAIDLQSLTAYMKNHYNIDMPKNPFRARSRKQFDFVQSYEVEPDILSRFKQWRQADYQLLDYIKKQPYYYTS